MIEVSATFVARMMRGLFPAGGSTVRLARQIPHCKAMEILLTGKPMAAEEAHRIGLINEIVAPDRLLPRAEELARLIAENGPLAVQAVLRSLRETEGMSEVDALKREMEIGQPIFATKDAMEGPRAFSEKRKPNFKGE